MRRTRLTLATLACACAALPLASCDVRSTPPLEAPAEHALDSKPGPPLPEGAEIEKAGSTAAHRASDEEISGSYRPDDRKAKERVPDIVKRGRLIVGVDRSNNLLSYRDAATGDVRGFEVDIAREISRDIFGDPNKVDFRFVESSDRVDALKTGAVDMIVRTMTISPERERDVAFSIPYMSTQTRMLVLTNSGMKSVKDAAGKTLCGVAASTALETIREHAPKSDILVTRSWGDCLMALQLNQADGIVVDDALLSGMAAQDSYTSIVGEPLETENYGVAVRRPSKQHDTRPLLRQVNSTLERIRRDGTWSRIFEEWLGTYLEEPTLPAGKYIEEDAKP